MKKLFIPLLIATLSGCAAYQPIPENYAGPTATVSDSSKYESPTKGQLFSLTEIDGHGITDSFETSRRASFNQGPKLTLHSTGRQLPAQSMRVKLRGSHITGMPVHELASRALGTFFEVEGIVDFSPIPNGTYIVTGQLAKNASSVWIEDAKTHERVTDKVMSK